MLKGLKLRDRILAGYAVPVAISVLVAGGVTVGVLQIQRLEAELARRNAVATGMQNAAFKLAVNQRLTRGNVIARGGDRTRLEDFRRNAATIRDFIATAANRIEDPAQAAKLREIRSLADDVLALEEAINLRVADGDLAGATIAVAGSPEQPSQTRALSKQLDRLIAEFQTRQGELVTASETALDSALGRLTSLVAIAAGVSALAAIAVGFALATRIARSIDLTVAEADRASADIADSLAQQERAISNQAVAVRETTATMEQLQAASRQVAEQASASAEGAQQTRDLAADGTQTVQNTTQGIAELQQQVAAVAEQILHLSQQVAEISTISRLVGDISQQTHVLSLTAAVEAARSGRDETGFATIAQQIRLLASQSQQSAERIGSVVRDIQTAIARARQTTDRSLDTASGGLGLTEETDRAFRDIARAIERVAAGSEQIALDNQQQSTGVRQVAESMALLDRGSQDIVGGTVQIKTAMETLSRSIRDLKAQV